MAKYNDMPELNSAKVFLTNHFTSGRHKLPRQHPLTAGDLHRSRHLAFQSIGQTSLQEPHRYCFENQHGKRKTLPLIAPGHYCPAGVLEGNSGMNGCTVYGLSCDNPWLKDEPAVFAQSVHSLPL